MIAPRSILCGLAAVALAACSATRDNFFTTASGAGTAGNADPVGRAGRPLAQDRLALFR